jgi:hypothetical protein
MTMCRAGAAVLAAYTLLIPLPATAATPRQDTLAAALPTRVVLGPPRGAAALAGVNGARDQISAHPLPRAARVLWSRTLASGIGCELLADEQGRVFIAGLGRLTQLSPAGRLEFSQSHGFSRPLAAALLNDGTRVVLAEDLQLIALTERGEPRFALRLGSASTAGASLLPLWDGGVLVALGAWLLNYDAHGNLRSSAELDERARVTLQSGRDVLIVGARGGVYRWDGHGGVVRSGSFARTVQDAALNGDSIIALLVEDELAELSLRTGSVETLSDRTRASRAPSGRGKDQRRLRAVAGASLLLLPFELDAPTSDLAQSASSWLGGADGALATISANGPLTLHRGDSTTSLGEVRCSDPVSLIPAGAGRIALGCRSGQIWLVGDEPPAAAPAHSRATEQ